LADFYDIAINTLAVGLNVPGVPTIILDFEILRGLVDIFFVAVVVVYIFVGYLAEIVLVLGIKLTRINSLVGKYFIERRILKHLLNLIIK
jgi:hypothetical protein